MWTTIKVKARAAWLKVKAWVYAGLVAIGLVAAPAAMSATKDFSWTNPTTRVDGSAYDAATEQVEVRIYCDGDTAPTFVAAGAATALTGDFSFGNHSCFATVVDQYGQESDPSNTVTFVLTPARPNPPGLSVN